MLLFHVRPDGTPAKIRVFHSSGWSELDLAAVQVIQEARIAPGIYHGCPVWTPIFMPVNWTAPTPPRLRN